MDDVSLKFDVSTSITGDVITSEIRNSLAMTIRVAVDTQEQQVQDALIKLGWTPPEKDKWISVDDRLPSYERDVLVLVHGKQSVCFRSTLHESWTDSMRMQHTNGGVTHWQPLPELPKEGEK